MDDLNIMQDTTGLNDSFEVSESRKMNNAMKRIGAPFYQVCSAGKERATGKLKVIWKRKAESCDNTYQNIRTVSEKTVAAYFEKNYRASLNSLKKDPEGYSEKLAEKLSKGEIKPVLSKAQAAKERIRVKKEKELLRKKAEKEKAALKKEKADLQKKAAKERENARKEKAAANKKIVDLRKIAAKYNKKKDEPKKAVIKEKIKAIQKGTVKAVKEVKKVEEEIKEVEKEIKVVEKEVKDISKLSVPEMTMRIYERPEPEEVVESTPHKKEPKPEKKHIRKPRYAVGTTAYHNETPVKIKSVIEKTDGYEYIVELPSGNASMPLEENELRHAPHRTAKKPEAAKRDDFIDEHIIVATVPKYDWKKIEEEKAERESVKAPEVSQMSKDMAEMRAVLMNLKGLSGIPLQMKAPMQGQTAKRELIEFNQTGMFVEAEDERHALIFAQDVANGDKYSPFHGEHTTGEVVMKPNGTYFVRFTGKR